MIDYDNSKNVINRIFTAYNLKTIKSLADKWGLTASVIGSTVQRNTFPSDFILKCVLDTGADINWLCTGQGESGIDGVHAVKKIVLSDDMLEKLERLNALKEKGAITADEFNILKANLI